MSAAKESPISVHSVVEWATQNSLYVQHFYGMGGSLIHIRSFLWIGIRQKLVTLVGHSITALMGSWYNVPPNNGDLLPSLFLEGGAGGGEKDNGMYIRTIKVAHLQRIAILQWRSRRGGVKGGT